MKDFGKKTWFGPLPVLIIGTYDKDGVPNAMNVAWGGIADTDLVDINLDKDRKTLENIRLKGCFTVAFATVSNMAESDYFGLVHGYGINKIEKTGMKCTPAKNVDAPVIEGYPMVLECKVTNISDQDIDGFRVFGKIVNVMADESVLTDGKPDLHKMDLIYYDPITLDYLTIGKTVGKSFSVGKKFMD